VKQNLQEVLFKKHPKLFCQKDLPLTQTAMCWGVDCGDGWFWLIDNLCHEIQSYVDSRVDSERIRRKYNNWKNIFVGYEWKWKYLRWYIKLFSKFKIYLNLRKSFNYSVLQTEVVQVKEKYGSLRFYVTKSDDTIYGMINFAEYLSSKICEDCGTIENVSQSTDGWITTLCETCRLKDKT
jgi:hypothetical protein